MLVILAEVRTRAKAIPVVPWFLDLPKLVLFLGVTVVLLLDILEFILQSLICVAGLHKLLVYKLC